MTTLTATQKKFFSDFEKATTFEAMHVDDVIAGSMTFDVAAKANCDWFENWMHDAHIAAVRAMHECLKSK